MNKGIKYALIFTSGVVAGFGVCGYKVVEFALTDKDIRKTIIHKISNRITKYLYGERSKIYQNDDFQFDNVVFETIHDAHKAYKEMEEIIHNYGFVTVADLYEAANLEKPYTFNKYGWTNIRNYEIEKASSGYIIDLPKPSPID